MISNSVIVAGVINMLAKKDKYGRLINEFTQFTYESVYAIFSDEIEANENVSLLIDNVVIRMHQARLIDLSREIEFGKSTPVSISLRPEGLELYRRLDI